MPVFCYFLLSESRIFVPCVTLLKALLSLDLRKFVQKVHFYNVYTLRVLFKNITNLLKALVGLVLVLFFAFFETGCPYV